MWLIEHLKKSVEDAELERSKISQEILELEGFSGNMTRHFYNNLLSIPGIRYLEIGTWLGSSLCSAMYKNKAKITCIDNWSQFSSEEDIQGRFLKNLNQYRGENEVTLIEADCFAVDDSKLQTYTVYLYDGAHSKEDHKKALTHFIDCLDDTFIYICDDWNWDDVRRGTIEAIQELNLEVLYSVEKIYEEDDPLPIPYHYGKATWWNGIWAGVLRKNPSSENILQQSKQ